MGKRWRRRVSQAALIGVGATATMDLGAEIIRRATGVAPLDYALLARWLGHMPQGRFRHDSIAAAAPVRGEKALGLITHYGIGVGFAGLLLSVHSTWGERPTLLPAIATGVGTTAAPFFLMQPAFGLGVAAAKTPHPTLVRLRSVRAHAIYGLGLYLSARALAKIHSV